MPLVGFTCPAWVPTAGEQHDLDHCLGKCPHPCAAAPLLASIYQANQTNYHVGAYISASMLAGRQCKRKVQWERFQPYYETAQRLFWPFRGTIVHALLETQEARIANYGWMQELKLSTYMEFPEHPFPVMGPDGFTGEWDESKPLTIQINGTTDLYNPFQLVIGDMKSMACGKAAKFIGGKHEDSWARQLNLYRWLVTKTPITEAMRQSWANAGLPAIEGTYLPEPTRVYIQGISMLEIPQTGSMYQPMRDQQLYQIPEIPLWPLADVEAFVRAEALGWFRTLVLKEPQPPIEKSEAWMCHSCCFNGEVIEGERCHPKAERAALAGEPVKIKRNKTDVVSHKPAPQPVAIVPFTLE
jgi:hypothetical protein